MERAGADPVGIGRDAAVIAGRRLGGAWARLRAALGVPGLMIGLFSLLSFAFGLVVLVREYNRPRELGHATLHQVMSGWVRVPGYLGTTLIDDVDRWREAPAREEPRRRAELIKAFNELGTELDRQSERFPLLRILGMELTPRSGAPVARWGRESPARPSPLDVVDRIPLLPAGDGPPVDLIVRYRIDPDVLQAARGLETSYHRLFLAVVGLSGFSLICLGYMVLHAQALSGRVAREAAREATLDLADRTCHELGNGVFVLSNERRNLADHLDLIDRFVSEEPQAREAAARRAGVEPVLFARWSQALDREYADRGLDPAHELRGSTAIAREVCRQIEVCSEYIALTVRELDGYLKHSALAVDLADAAVSECIDEALILLRPALEASGAVIDRCGAATLVVHGDRRLLVHALVNLLKNAVEASAAAGNTPRIRIETRLDGETCWIAVADRGPGISRADLPRIFEAGYSTKGSGRGRGLAVVHQSIEAQRGSIEVSSRPGEGTEFRIGLPAALA